MFRLISNTPHAMGPPSQIVADRNGSKDDRLLAELGPGALVEVSQVVIGQRPGGGTHEAVGPKANTCILRAHYIV
jgi:hypothetical protein